MSFSLVTPNIEKIKEARNLGVLDRVTTNPLLITKEGSTKKDKILRHYLAICDIVEGDLPSEVVTTGFDEILNKRKEFSELYSQIVVKVPMIRDGVKAIKYFSDNDIHTNCFLGFYAGQTLLTGKVGTSNVSPLFGRLDHIFTNGLRLIADVITGTLSSIDGLLKHPLINS